jgi:hypothetical protein
MSNTKIINTPGSRDVLLRIGNLTWSRLPARLKKELLEGLIRIAGVRADIASQAKVPTMPPVEVIGQIWVKKAPHTDSSAPPVLEGTIDGRASPLRLHREVAFGAQLPALTAICPDASVLRHVLIHEFSHCFFEIVRVIDLGVATL